MKQKTIKIKKLHKDAIIPSYAKPGDAGMDLTATEMEYDKNTDCYIYHTGLAFELPSGYMMNLYPRSSNRKTDCYLTNSVGVLDSGFRGELLLCYKNRTAYDSRNILEKFTKIPEDYAPYKVGERIGQLVIMPYPEIVFDEVNELSHTERGKDGFGSTGK